MADDKADDKPTDETAGAQAPDSEDWGRTLAALAEQGRRIAQAFVERQSEGSTLRIPDPFVIGRAFLELGAKMLADPAKLAAAQAAWWSRTAELWQATGRRMAGEEAPATVEPAPGDRRFKDEAWTSQALFDFVKQSYLLTAGWLRSTVDEVEGLDPKTREKVDFYTRQFIDAMAPTNFAATNPAVLRATAESRGENLLKGLKNLLDDLERGKGRLRISMTDTSAFEIGGNIAVTPGKVVYQNDLMQLVQYAPATDTVYARPLLIVPPWINKYYILDLRPRNSFVRWAVERGYTVFVISWVNPGAELADKTFEDYMREGPLDALDAIETATGATSANLIVSSLGGTLTACTLAYMAATGDDRVAAATFFTAMTDFAEAGELGVFIDDEQLALLERHMRDKGYLEGRHMAQVFNLMRANDLIWSFVVHNYLLGRDPPPFDLLYWNSDATRMPAMMHGFYLRNMYRENRLTRPGGISLAGVPIDLGRIARPVYFLSTKEDHIAPWKSTYGGTRLVGGPARFVLAASGHIAGVVNPPAAKKYGYWTNDSLPPAVDDWFAGATWHEGSWWPDWHRWLRPKSGRKVAARVPGEGGLPAIEDAPGSYVKVRAED